MVKNEKARLEEEVVSDDGNNTTRSCMKISGFVLCVGMPYSFTVGRRLIIGIVEEINPRFLRVIIRADNNSKVLIDLRKVSVIEEVK